MNGTRETVVGEIRPSQLLWTYGPGASIDLPNLSVVTMGLDRWDPDLCRPVQEPRLLYAVRRVLGHQVERLLIPPVSPGERLDPFSEEAKRGVPVKPFPRWLRCVKCGLLAEFDSGLFECKPNPFRPELTRFVHVNCDKGRNADAVPARFLLACRKGHLDDFPWHWFVHGGPSSCKGTLRFFESGASLQTENLWVKCDECGARKSMARAFGQMGAENLPGCRGRHPHLDRFEDCDEPPRAILLGATNGWFPITISSLAIPLGSDPVAQLVEENWDVFGDVESLEELRITIRTLVKRNAVPGIDKHSPEAIWSEIESRRRGDSESDLVTDVDMKVPEWQVFTAPEPPLDWPHFMVTKVDAPTRYADWIRSVVLVERLREVNALVGFTRVEPPEEAGENEERPGLAPLSNGPPRWVPVNEVHGEGIFIQFDEARIVEWLGRDEVAARDEELRKGHRGWRNARRLDPNEGYPGIRYVMLHTFAHLLLRELALECGYNAASIRERVYASKEGDEVVMAGVLLYTAAADSDGTLGGLVELGKPDNLGRLMAQALDRARICSSDPLCSEHLPEKDRSLHAAACHACSFAAETSCERGNRYLDRALLVPIVGHENAAFFGWSP